MPSRGVASPSPLGFVLSIIGPTDFDKGLGVGWLSCPLWCFWWLSMSAIWLRCPLDQPYQFYIYSKSIKNTNLRSVLGSGTNKGQPVLNVWFSVINWQEDAKLLYQICISSFSFNLLSYENCSHIFVCIFYNGDNKFDNLTGMLIFISAYFIGNTRIKNWLVTFLEIWVDQIVEVLNWPYLNSYNIF